jgi:putative hemolysin
VRLADCEREVRAAQALRYRVFYDYMGARGSHEVRRHGLDFDRFDAFCDHLLVMDHSAGGAAPRVVGTYRLLTSSRAVDGVGFYSASEYDLSALDRFPGEKLELGRSCVDPAYRSKAVLQMLWKGISAYLDDNGIGLMFGCASFPGTDIAGMAMCLSHLAYNYTAPAAWRPRAVPDRYIDLRLLARDQIDLRRVQREMPPLIKGYLRAGGVIGDGAVIDAEFNTVDVCLMVETGNVADKYRRHAPRYAAEKPPAAAPV